MDEKNLVTVQIDPTLLAPKPEPPYFAFPMIGELADGLPLIVVFSVEQAESLGAAVSPPFTFLCVDIPRAKLCQSVADADLFFKGEN